MVTDDRHFVNIGLKTGRIVSVHHGPRCGSRALERILNISGGCLSLLPTQDLRPQPDLPSTQEILDVLEGGQIHQTKDQQPTSLSQGESILPLPQAGGAASPLAISNQELVRDLYEVEEALLQIIGPIAKIVMKEAAMDVAQIRSGDDMARLVEILCREIDDPTQAQQFTERFANSL